MKRPVRPDSWYILDFRNLLSCKVLSTRFLTERAADFFIQRGLNNKRGYKPIKGEDLAKFQVSVSRVKRKFYSKYEVEDWRLLDPQKRKTLRTVIRRRLFGYIRVIKYSIRCDACRKSNYDNDKFAKIPHFLIKGRILRACKTCIKKYEKKYKENGTLKIIRNNVNSRGL